MPNSNRGKWCVRAAFALLLLSWPIQVAARQLHAPEPWPSLDMPGFEFRNAASAPQLRVTAIHAVTSTGENVDFTTDTFFPFPLSTGESIESQSFSPSSDRAPRKGYAGSLLGNVYPFRNYFASRFAKDPGRAPDTRAWLLGRLAELRPGTQFDHLIFEWHTTGPLQPGVTNPPILDVATVDVSLR